MTGKSVHAFSLLGIAGMLLAACGSAPAAIEHPAATATEAATATQAPTATVTATTTPTMIPKAVIKIATQSPLSGNNSIPGTDIKRAAELAIEQLAGPLAEMGFKVELAAFDDQADPDIGVANAKHITADPAILCGVGHYNSRVFISASPHYHKAGLAFISPSATDPQVTSYSYLEINRVVGRDDMDGIVAADFIASQGIKSVYVVDDTSAYGKRLTSGFGKEARKLGIKAIGTVSTSETTHFDSLVAKIIAGKPDVVYFGGWADRAGPLFRQARDAGFAGGFIGSEALGIPNLLDTAGSTLLDGGGMFYTSLGVPPSNYPDAAQFVKDFNSQYGSDPQPYSAQAYDATAICLKAIENAAKDNDNEVPTRAEVAKAVRALKDFPGITGTINFNKKGDLAKAKYFIFKANTVDPDKWGLNPIVQALDIAPPP
jgi:branched-chain amino acid transport system substrate-binding protein